MPLTPSALTRLTTLASLSTAQHALLRSYAIGSVEDLAGTLVSDPTAVQKLLGRDTAAFAALQHEVDAVVRSNPEFSAEFERQRSRTYHAGALDPDSD